MVARRTILRTTAAAGTAGLAGCSVLDSGDEGYVQLKAILGIAGEDGTRSEESVIRLSLASPPGSGPPELRQHVDEWVERFDDPRNPIVSNELHNDLRRAYDEVSYLVGVCSPAWADDDESIGCYNVRTTRENFNAVQVHQRVRASSDGTYLNIHSTDGEWTFDSNGNED